MLRRKAGELLLLIFKGVPAVTWKPRNSVLRVMCDNMYCKKDPTVVKLMESPWVTRRCLLDMMPTLYGDAVH